MIKIKNLNEALRSVTFQTRNENWNFQPAHVSNGFNPTADGIVKGYITDSTHFTTTPSKRNVFGFRIDFGKETIELNLHRKGIGWNPIREWDLCDHRKFRHWMSSKVAFVELIRTAIEMDIVWSEYAR